jgi:GDPmannose 4,6-dehydratase
MPQKTALINGAIGQDGAYLAELLLEKDYIVHGVNGAHPPSTPDAWTIFMKTRMKAPRQILSASWRPDRFHQPDPHHAGTQSDEIYNLAAQSHVAVSFETPEYTANADTVGTLRLLEAIRILKLEKRASTRPQPPKCSAWCRTHFDDAIRKAYDWYCDNRAMVSA